MEALLRLYGGSKKAVTALNTLYEGTNCSWLIGGDRDDALRPAPRQPSAHS